jgi:RNA polymerase sigma-70 factor (ECF subfamily)
MKPSAESQELLDAAYEAAVREWPTVSVSREVFDAHVLERVPPGEDDASAIGKLCLSDLYLACACSRGDEAALGAFDAAFLSPGALAKILGRMHMAAEAREEIRQRLRERLFVAASAAPRIEAYAGRGPLRGWLAITATRLAIDLLERDGRDARRNEELSDRALGPATDPELVYIKERYQGEFRAAFEDALSVVDRRDRTLLRMHYVEGLSMDRVAAIYGVGRSTAYRWIERARSALLAATTERLQARLELSQGELQSMVVLVRSELDVSLARLLASQGAK